MTRWLKPIRWTLAALTLVFSLYAYAIWSHGGAGSGDGMVRAVHLLEISLAAAIICGAAFMLSRPSASSVPRSVEASAGSPILCLGCDYVLVGLAENRCPECGRAFDPADPTTVSTLTRSERFWRTAKKRWIIPLGLILSIAPPFCVMLANGGNGFEIVLPIWVSHTLVAGILSAPLIWFGRRRAQWQSWEILGFVIPLFVWLDLMIFDGTGKSLANLGEFVAVTFATPLVVLARLAVGRRRRQWLWSLILLILLCGVAVGVYVLTPPLPE